MEREEEEGHEAEEVDREEEVAAGVDDQPKQGLLSPEDAKRYNMRSFCSISYRSLCLTLHIQIKVILIGKLSLYFYIKISRYWL